MAVANKTIYVYADWEGLNDKPVLMGILTAEHLRGNEIFSFEYNGQWLQAEHPFSLDPNLQLFGGQQYNNADKPNFGLFLDSSPDRWGRVLMRRREAIIARKKGNKPGTLFESDYLLGVFDEHRMGGLRFKTEPEGEFLSAEKELPSPPWTSLSGCK